MLAVATGEFCKKMVEIFSTNPDAASTKDSMHGGTLAVPP